MSIMTSTALAVTIMSMSIMTIIVLAVMNIMTIMTMNIIIITESTVLAGMTMMPMKSLTASG